MGYYCGLRILIQSASSDRTQAIIDALAGLTTPDKWAVGHEEDGRLCLEYDNDQSVSWGQWSGLWDGEGRDEIARAVWKANGKACDVRVTVIALEDCPEENSEYTEEDYEEIMKEKTAVQGDENEEDEADDEEDETDED